MTKTSTWLIRLDLYINEHVLVFRTETLSVSILLHFLPPLQQRVVFQDGELEICASMTSSYQYYNARDETYLALARIASTSLRPLPFRTSLLEMVGGVY
nr:hypothetical protein CFP56_53377 [Quercus suber]